jgi:hypothetical protein
MMFSARARAIGQRQLSKPSPERVWREQRTAADEIHDEKPDCDRRRSKKPGDQAFADDAVPCAHGVSRH